MRNILKIIILLFIITSCNHISIQDNYKPKYTSKQLQERLDRYYKVNSTDSLRVLLSEWAAIIPTSTSKFMNQDDTLKNLFQIFNELYSPYKFGDEKAENYFDKKFEFIVIQNEIEYSVLLAKELQSYEKYIVNGFPNDSIRDYFFRTKQLLNFRPSLRFDSVKCLYFTKEYRTALNNFLISDYENRDSLELWRIPYTDPNIIDKYEFLGKILPIVHGHGGEGWYIISFPDIHRIVFDDKFKTAFVSFRRSFSETIYDYRLIKTGGHWKSDKNRIIRMSTE